MEEENIVAQLEGSVEFDNTLLTQVACTRMGEAVFNNILQLSSEQDTKSDSIVEHKDRENVD